MQGNQTDLEIGGDGHGAGDLFAGQDLLAFAETLEALMPKAAACVVGGAKQLAPLDPAKTVPVSSR